MIFVAYGDWRHRVVPNALTYGGILLAAALQFGVGVDCGIGSLVTGLFSAFFIFLPFLCRAAGAADVKLMFAAGVFAGPGRTFPLLAAVSVVGLALVAVMIFMKAANPARLKHYFRSVFDFRYDRKAGAAALPPKDDEKSRVPFGVAIGLGLLIVLLAEAA